jgi:hypothetical protein
MTTVRLFRSVRLCILLVVVVALPTAGCGSGDAGTQVQVSPEFQKKTANMLQQISADQMAKYKAKTKRGR